MKKSIRINFIHRTASLVFWKEGPLLFDVAHIVPTLAPHDLLSKSSAGVFFRESKLPRLLVFHEKQDNRDSH